MTIKELKELVIKEATYLRENTTQQEKDRLEVFDFNPRSSRYCIYGQLTGNCNSNRAALLYDGSGIGVVFYGMLGTDSTKSTLNTVEIVKEKQVDHFSPIETYIGKYNNDGKEILRYIKGDIDRFVLRQK